MKLKLKLIINSVIALTAICLNGCTQPDGNIGPWFGSWYLEEILIDGQEDSEYLANKKEDRLQVMVSFQGNVFNMAYLNGSAIYGVWSYAGEILTLIADYNAGSGYASAYFNPYPIVMHFPKDVTQLEIKVTEINKKKMQWQYVDTQGRLITYNFKKYP